MAKNRNGERGLHVTIWESNADMVTYLLENVYFPNNDKSFPDGIAFLNMMILGKRPLTGYVLGAHINTEHYDPTRHFEMFKLLVSYGMKVNYTNLPQTSLEFAIEMQHTRIAQFMLNENLCPIYTFEDVVQLMYVSDDKSFTDDCANIYNCKILNNIKISNN